MASPFHVATWEFPLPRGTAAHSEGEAPQGDVDAVNPEVVEEPHQHPPSSLTLGHPLRRDFLVLRPYLIILSKSIRLRKG